MEALTNVVQDKEKPNSMDVATAQAAGGDKQGAVDIHTNEMGTAEGMDDVEDPSKHNEVALVKETTQRLRCIR